MSGGSAWHLLGADGEGLPLVVPDAERTLMVPDDDELCRDVFFFACCFLACFLARLLGGIISGGEFGTDCAVGAILALMEWISSVIAA